MAKVSQVAPHLLRHFGRGALFSTAEHDAENKFDGIQVEYCKITTRNIISFFLFWCNKNPASVHFAQEQYEVSLNINMEEGSFTFGSIVSSELLISNFGVRLSTNCHSQTNPQAKRDRDIANFPSLQNEKRSNVRFHKRKRALSFHVLQLSRNFWSRTEVFGGFNGSFLVPSAKTSKNEELQMTCGMNTSKFLCFSREL